MKQLLLPSPQQVLNHIPHIPDAHTVMDTGMMARDENHVGLFGIRCNGHGVRRDRQNRFKWRMLPLVPGSQRNLGGFIYGTLDRALSVMMQAKPYRYIPSCNIQDPVWPSHMYHMINRKQALQDYTFQLLGHLHQAAGGRFEARVRASACVAAHVWCKLDCQVHAACATASGTRVPRPRVMLGQLCS